MPDSLAMDLRDQWNRLLPHAQPLGDDLLAVTQSNNATIMISAT